MEEAVKIFIDSKFALRTHMVYSSKKVQGHWNDAELNGRHSQIKHMGLITGKNKNDP